jgi:hypothetical protein
MNNYNPSNISINRENAIRNKLNTYQGRACKNCATTEKYVIGWACVKCARKKRAPFNASKRAKTLNKIISVKSSIIDDINYLEKDIISIYESCKVLRIGISTIRKYIDNGFINPLSNESCTLKFFSKRELLNYMNNFYESSKVKTNIKRGLPRKNYIPTKKGQRTVKNSTHLEKSKRITVLRNSNIKSYYMNKMRYVLFATRDVRYIQDCRLIMIILPVR